MSEERPPPQIFQPSWRLGEGRLPRLVVQPTIRFMRVEAAGGIIIVLFAVIALIWVNIDAHSYEAFWSTVITFDFDVITLEESLEGWVNDALMVIFFFVVGLEIKREATHGELADRKAAALPVFAALGGMVGPAVVFTLLNLNSGGGAGWGIPVATDIAFALGVLALVGKRIPLQLRIFLLALAVADDIGGIMIIAVFYADDLSLGWLASAFGFVGLILVMQRIGVRSIPAYVLVALGLWLCTFESGIEPTIAGVVLGLLTPVSPIYALRELPPAIHARLDALSEALAEPNPRARESMGGQVVREVEELSRESASPLERVEDFLSPWSAFVVIPIFALANAGIQLSGDVIDDALSSRVAWGVVGGLLLGKLVGILLFSFISVRLGWAVKPRIITWPQLGGVALLGGIGFTVAIFIAGLAYDDPILVEEAKIGILFASILAAILGFIILRSVPAPSGDGDAVPAEEVA